MAMIILRMIVIIAIIAIILIIVIIKIIVIIVIIKPDRNPGQGQGRASSGNVAASCCSV